jgi:hypothetical protein
MKVHMTVKKLRDICDEYVKNGEGGQSVVLCRGVPDEGGVDVDYNFGAMDLGLIRRETNMYDRVLMLINFDHFAVLKNRLDNGVNESNS